VNVFSIVLLLAISLPLAYLYLLALAAVRPRSIQPSQQPQHRFAIAIPAHNEEAVIGHTVATWRQVDYPPHLFDIHVVADHCTDRTAQIARAAGATVHERHEEPRGSKGAALRWLFARVLDEPILNSQSAIRNPQSAIRNPYDAVVIFDADTIVHPHFLRLMDARLAQGDQVIQGQHRIGNPDDGWFPALTWATFMVDNRFQNLGRSNLGWSAKNMGDSICFRADVLRRLGWGEGLTEDYAFRQQLLLEGIKIRYEPAAIGYGEAPLTWQIARAQHARWLKGSYEASRHYARQLLGQGLQRRDLALLDGALQAYLPSYSTLTVIALAAFTIQLALAICDLRSATCYLLPATYYLQLATSSFLLVPWFLVLGALVVYPFLGLTMERAPLRAYLVILAGPWFILWRTWLALTARLGWRRVEWVRTPRREEKVAR
jgi:cellulose synthase/poly-beta-1,6-N-acetylglucosamine synthase-like glycosyltransferase